MFPDFLLKVLPSPFKSAILQLPQRWVWRGLWSATPMFSLHSGSYSFCHPASFLRFGWGPSVHGTPVAEGRTAARPGPAVLLVCCLCFLPGCLYGLWFWGSPVSQGPAGMCTSCVYSLGFPALVILRIYLFCVGKHLVRYISQYCLAPSLSFFLKFPLDIC